MFDNFMISNFNVYDVSRTQQLTTIEDFSNSLHTDLEWNASDPTCQRRHPLHSPWIVGRVWNYEWRGHRRYLRCQSTGRPVMMQYVYSSESLVSLQCGGKNWRVISDVVNAELWISSDTDCKNCEYYCRLDNQFKIRWVRDTNKL